MPYPKMHAHRKIDWRLAASLTGILVVALGLRAWGINFGLPLRVHVDEPAYVLAALKLASGQFKIDYPMLAPNIHQVLLAFGYGIVYGVGKLIGIYASTGAFAQSYKTDPAVFYLLGRWLSIMFSLGSLVVLYRFGATFADKKTGLAAAMLLAVAFIDVRQAHFTEPYPLISFFALLSSYLAFCWTHSSRMRHLWWSFALAGAAIGLRFSLVPVIFAPLLAVFLSGWSIRPRAAYLRQVFQRVAFGGLAAGAGFLAAYPGLLLNPGSFVHALRTFSDLAAGGHGFQGFVITSLSGAGFYTRTLVIGLGLPLLALAVLGLLSIVWKQDRRKWVLLIFPVCYLAVLLISQMVFIRYMLPLVHYIILLGSIGAVEISRVLTRQRQTWQSMVLAGWVLIVGLSPLVNSIRHDRLLTRQDTRLEARQWIENNIPANSKIALQWFTPSLATKSDPEAGTQRIYRLVTVEPFDSDPAPYMLEYYRQLKVKYMVLSSFITELPRVDPQEQAARQAFYRSVATEGRLLAEFNPFTSDPEPFWLDEVYTPFFSLNTRWQPGPVILIYEIP